MLAESVGTLDVDGMLDSLPAPLFVEWIEFLGFRHGGGEGAEDDGAGGMLGLAVHSGGRRKTPEQMQNMLRSLASRRG